MSFLWRGALIAGFISITALQAWPQSFATLHHFTATPLFPDPQTNADGVYPLAGLVMKGGRLFGTASQGGVSGNGTIFTLNTDGTSFTNLYSFSGAADGGGPVAGLALSGSTLFGTTFGGGGSGEGTVFAVNTDGTVFSTLYTFQDSGDGANPSCGLVVSGNTLYGTASRGGLYGNGAVFAVKTDGTGFTNLYNFSAFPENPPFTNSDGAKPVAGLVLANGTLYGTTSAGGLWGNGTVFSFTLPQVSPPQLRISLAGPDVILSWPTNAPGFLLQSTTNLAPSGPWSTNLPRTTRSTAVALWAS